MRERHGRLCSDPHDFANAKYVAGRNKDLVFTRELATRGLVAQDRLKVLLDAVESANLEEILKAMGINTDLWLQEK